MLQLLRHEVSVQKEKTSDARLCHAAELFPFRCVHSLIDRHIPGIEPLAIHQHDVSDFQSQHQYNGLEPQDNNEESSVT